MLQSNCTNNFESKCKLHDIWSDWSTHDRTLPHICIFTSYSVNDNGHCNIFFTSTIFVLFHPFHFQMRTYIFDLCSYTNTTYTNVVFFPLWKNKIIKISWRIFIAGSSREAQFSFHISIYATKCLRTWVKLQGFIKNILKQKRSGQWSHVTQCIIIIEFRHFHQGYQIQFSRIFQMKKLKKY